MNLNKMGFYIKELRVIGKNKIPASLCFSEGANVIAGGSDTGKSYAFSCITYALGTSKTPKEVTEAKGYDTVILEINDYRNSYFTIKRRFNDSKVSIKRGKIDEHGQWEEYSAENKGKSKNLSNFLLDLVGYDESKYLKYNASNIKRELSYRYLRGLTLIDEMKIIAESSPIFFSSNNIEQTIEFSAFKLLITGEDDKDLETVEEQKLYKSRITGKIEMLKQLLEDDVKILESFGNLSIQTALNVLEDKLLILFDKLNKQNEIVENLTFSRKSYNDIKIKTQSKLDFQYELIKRFNLLIQHYKTDLERLDFVDEGFFLFSQLKNVNCPVCGGHLDNEHIICLDDNHKNNSQFEKSLQAEITKINLKLTDLKETISEAEKISIILESEIKEINVEIRNIDSEISAKIKPIILELKEEINVYSKEKEKFTEYSSISNRMDSYSNKLNTLENDIKNSPKAKKRDELIEADALNNFCKIVEDVLIKFNYPKVNKVAFDVKNQDILINNIQRQSSGKGFRAVTYSAFIIGLMKYCYELNLPHTRSIVLDSPLTTYKKGDTIPSNDSVNYDMDSGFFSYIANLGADMQVIVFDNKEPNENLKDKINYIHFTKDTDIGRKGFFQV